MRITANMVTIARIVLLPIPGYLVYGGTCELVAALCLIVVLGLTDWLDGIMARREGPTLLGGLLDPIADKIFIAVIYLPLADRGVIPLWIAATIFARDFLVTSLRTSLSLRDAPMRTSTAAKFKTAMQMMGAGYILFYLAVPECWITWAITIGPIALPLGLVIYRLAKGRKQGPRSVTLVALMILAVAIRRNFSVEWTIQIYLYIITAMTLASGVEYLYDAWSALVGTAGSLKEVARFLLDGLLVPVAFVLLLDRPGAGWISALAILSITLELAVGGLGNLLASRKVTPRFRWMALKSILQVLLAAAALALGWSGVDLGFPAAEICVALAATATAAYTAVSFWRHRAVYLAAI